MQNNTFTEIAPGELNFNVFNKIGRDWMLVTAQKPGGAFNQMTASWGGMGIMWNLPVCCCVIRPQRYTYEFIEDSRRLSLSFLGEEYRGALKHCGSISGRGRDKAAETGLTPVVDAAGAVYYEEANLALICRKLYADDFKEGGFIDRSLLANYAAGDFHRMYICKIERVLIK